MISTPDFVVMDGIQVKKNSVTSTSTASARRRPRGFGQMSSVVTDLMNLFIAFSSIDYRCDGRNSNFERKKKEEKEDKKNSRTRTTKGRDRSGERPVREKKAKKIGKFLRKKCGSESTREREKKQANSVDSKTESLDKSAKENGPKRR